MSVMHIRLETEPDAFNDVPGGPPEGTGSGPANTTTHNHHSNHNHNKGGAAAGSGGGLHGVHSDEWLDDATDLLNDDDLLQGGGGGRGRGGGGGGGAGVSEMVDLLDLNDDDDNHHHHNSNNNLLLPLPPVPPSAPSSSSGGSGGVGGAASGLGGLGLSNDPFSSPDPFSLHTPSSAPALPLALALSPAQLAQHRAWGQGALVNGGGPLYDDGTLQVTPIPYHTIPYPPPTLVFALSPVALPFTFTP